MKTKSLMTLGALLGTCLIASAQDESQRNRRADRQMGPPPELIKKFDTDGDGKLSDDERKAMREAMEARMEERRKEMLEKYDTDKDGKLSEEERRQARAAEMIEKFDKDGDGKLDQDELAAMPMPPTRPGGPGGRRGPGGPGNDGPPPVEEE